MNKNPNTYCISVIVPVYKAENFIDKCIESIVSQSYENLEIILIDDGSPDSSGAKCDDYALEDKRIKVIHQKNSGVSSARNAGLKVATGDFVMFVDSDDLIHKELCETLISLMDDSCDIVVTEFYKSERFNLIDNGIEDTLNDEDNITVCYGEMEKAFQNMMAKYILNCPYAKLFKREIIGAQQFDIDITLGEDLLFNMEYLKKIKGCIKVSTYKGYMYYIANSNSITNNFRENNFETALYLNKKMLEFASAFNFNKSTIDWIDKILAMDVMSYFEDLYLCDRKRSYKREKVLFCLNNEDIMRCFGKNYVFSKHNSVLFHLIKKKRERCIRLFFKLKKLAKKLLSAK